MNLCLLTKTELKNHKKAIDGLKQRDKHRNKERNIRQKL